MLSIEKSEKFQKELNDWTMQLEKVTNENVKKEISLLLNNLVKQVRLLDNCHNDLGTTNRISTNTLEFRQAILEIRKAIHKKFHEVSMAGHSE